MQRHSHSHLCDIQIHHHLSHVWLQFLEALSLLLWPSQHYTKGQRMETLQWTLQCPVDAVLQESCSIDKSSGCWHIEHCEVCTAWVSHCCPEHLCSPGRKNFQFSSWITLVCCKCTPKSLTMMVFEKNYTCQAMDRYPLPFTAEQGQETAMELNRAAPCPRAQPPLLPWQRSLWAPSPTCFRKISQLRAV